MVAMLFILTGIAIVIYLNQYPYQPRERDYAFAGSFYAFAIWIGLGVLYLWEWLSKVVDSKVAATVATVAALGIPVLMAAENWDDHDRSGRYAARDFAWNYLNSTEEDAIIFTNGDNDTFPLWYAQEVEGIRTDVRVCNLSYLQTGWYIDQMRHKAYDSKPVQFSLSKDQTRDGQLSVAYINPNLNKGKIIDLSRAIDFIGSDRPEAKLNNGASFFPGTKYSIPVDSAYVVNNGTVRPEDVSKVADNFIIDLEGMNYVGKNSLMVLDILATNQWQRPVYYAVTVPDENYVNLDRYFQVEGLAYRIVPVDNGKGSEGGRVATDIMYDNMMNKFKWGGVDKPGIWMDQTILRMCLNYRNNFTRLANELLNEGKTEMAKNVMLKAIEVLPKENVPFDRYSIVFGQSLLRVGLEDEAKEVFTDVKVRTEENLEYYFSMSEKFQKSLLSTIQSELGVLQYVHQIAMQNGLKEMSDEIAEKFGVYYEKFQALQ